MPGIVSSLRSLRPFKVNSTVIGQLMLMAFRHPWPMKESLIMLRFHTCVKRQVGLVPFLSFRFVLCYVLISIFISRRVEGFVESPPTW